MISSGMVAYLSEGDKCSYLIEISFRMELRWVWVAQVRCYEGELVFGKALVIFMDGFWALGLNGNDSELENGNSVFNGETRFWSRVFLVLQAWFLDGKPSPILGKVMGLIDERMREIWSEIESDPKHAWECDFGDTSWHVLTWFALPTIWFRSLASNKWN